MRSGIDRIFATTVTCSIWKRHDAFSVGKRIHGCKKECVAVTLEFYDLRAGVLLPLLPLGAGKLRQSEAVACCR